MEYVGQWVVELEDIKNVHRVTLKNNILWKSFGSISNHFTQKHIFQKINVLLSLVTRYITDEKNKYWVTANLETYKLYF